MGNGEQGEPPVGRPRKFADADIFLATGRVILDRGYASLTISAIAQELGCSGPALLNRFGSKSGLLRAYLCWAIDASQHRFQQVREVHTSPLAALRARFLIPRNQRSDEVTDPHTTVNLVVFHVAAWADPELRELEQTRTRLFEEEIAALLEDAIQVGELAPCDARGLGRLIVTAMTGTVLRWASDQERAVEDRLVEVIEELIAPYRIGAG